MNIGKRRFSFLFSFVLNSQFQSILLLSTTMAKGNNSAKKVLRENEEVSEQMSKLARSIVILGNTSMKLHDVIREMLQEYRRSEFQVSEHFWSRFQIIGPSIEWRNKMMRCKYFKLNLLGMRCPILKGEQLKFLDPRATTCKYWIRLVDVPYGWRTSSGVNEIVRFGKVCSIDYCNLLKLEDRWIRVQVEVAETEVIPEYEIFDIEWLKGETEQVKIWFVVEGRNHKNENLEIIKQIPKMVWSNKEQELKDEYTHHGNKIKSIQNKRKAPLSNNSAVIAKKHNIGSKSGAAVTTRHRTGRRLDIGIQFKELDTSQRKKHGTCYSGKGKALVVDKSAERKMLKKALRNSRDSRGRLGKSSNIERDSRGTFVCHISAATDSRVVVSPGEKNDNYPQKDASSLRNVKVEADVVEDDDDEVVVWEVKDKKCNVWQIGTSSSSSSSSSFSSFSWSSSD